MVVVVLEGGRLIGKKIAVSGDQTRADGVKREVVDRVEHQIGSAIWHQRGRRQPTYRQIRKLRSFCRVIFAKNI
jgi:hypothetical protein